MYYRAVMYIYICIVVTVVVAACDVYTTFNILQQTDDHRRCLFVFVFFFYIFCFVFLFFLRTRSFFLCSRRARSRTQWTLLQHFVLYCYCVYCTGCIIAYYVYHTNRRSCAHRVGTTGGVHKTDGEAFRSFDLVPDHRERMLGGWGCCDQAARTVCRT